MSNSTIDNKHFKMADLNLDGNVDILDIIIIVNFILLGEDPDFFYLYKSDLDKTGQIDILDIILLLDIIL